LRGKDSFQGVCCAAVSAAAVVENDCQLAQESPELGFIEQPCCFILIQLELNRRLPGYNPSSNDAGGFFHG
jgi:hypothetical protein